MSNEIFSREGEGGREREREREDRSQGGSYNKAKNNASKYFIVSLDPGDYLPGLLAKSCSNRQICNLKDLN